METAIRNKLLSIVEVYLPYSTNFYRKNSSHFIAIIVFSFITIFAFKATASENCTLVEPPKTSFELIQNIKCAVARNIFFDDDVFTSDEKLWKLFGGNTFSRGYPNPQKSESLAVTYFPNSIDKPSPKTTWIPDQLSIVISKEITPPDPPPINSSTSRVGLDIIWNVLKEGIYG